MARLHREILDTLLRRIADGHYEVGSRLPKEEELKADFGVARGTAREALRALEERNVATVRHGLGAIVQPQEEWNVLDPAVARALSAGRGSRAFLGELSEYRLLLGSEAAALAAERATTRQREQIRAAGQEVAVTGHSERIRTLVADAARNRALGSALRRVPTDGSGRATGPALKAYERLAEAVADGDPDAARTAARRVHEAS
jgi:DNA-binding FadR family transcriptional regulator